MRDRFQSGAVGGVKGTIRTEKARSKSKARFEEKGETEEEGDGLINLRFPQAPGKQGRVMVLS